MAFVHMVADAPIERITYVTDSLKRLDIFKNVWNQLIHIGRWLCMMYDV